jgi:AAA domain (dynein-related subfamily)
VRLAKGVRQDIARVVTQHLTRSFQLMSIEPGDAFAFTVNSHRHQWNGQICANPVHWQCGSPNAFREGSCDRGAENCFHLRLFAPDEPRFITPDVALAQAFADNSDLLDDQICFFVGQKFNANEGRQVGSIEQVLYGAYRVKRAYLETAGFNSKPQLVLEPYHDGWALFPQNTVRKPATPPALDGISYLRRINARSAGEAVREAVLAGKDAPTVGEWSGQWQKRLEQFAETYDAWCETAKQKMEVKPVAARASRFSTGGPAIENAFAALKHISFRKLEPVESAVDPSPADLGEDIDASRPNIDEKTIEPAVAGQEPSYASEGSAKGASGTQSETQQAPEASLDSVTSDDGPWDVTLPEAECASEISAEYGERTLTALQIATLTKTLLILAGPPGVGKSWLASRLIDDSARTRSIIVAVSSTWRGKEDLLGYVNPVTGEFEATTFTRFLLRAQDAWDAGDRRPWLVIFEEFNLSQPEHWLSDLLVRLEYEPGRRADRTIHLGGVRLSGSEVDGSPAVFLTPNLKLVATLNNDHTVRPLSPRVLDRAALLEVSATGRAALQRVGVVVSADVEDIVENLNDLLEAHGVAFSVRSALSLLKATITMGDSSIMTVLDHVLSQQVLSKVRLMAGDPRDEQLLSRIQEWLDRPTSSQLVLCAEKIAGWEAALRAGRDVCQA